MRMSFSAASLVFHLYTLSMYSDFVVLLAESDATSPLPRSDPTTEPPQSNIIQIIRSFGTH